MRIPAVLLALSLATPAFAQVIPAPITPQDSGALVQQEITRQQLIQQQNQLMALEAQQRALQAQQAIEALKVDPRLPQPDVSGARPLPEIDTSKLASIPDAALADSNQKVLDAANNRR
jgi:hypothetical protein